MLYFKGEECLPIRGKFKISQEVLIKPIRFSEIKIVVILKSEDAGIKMKDLRLEYGLSDATHPNWEAKYSDMKAYDLRHLKKTDSNLSKLKRMYADLASENQVVFPYFCRRSLFRSYFLPQSLSLNTSQTNCGKANCRLNRLGSTSNRYNHSKFNFKKMAGALFT